MEKFVSENPGLKRLLTMLLGVGTVALNKKFGLNLGDLEIEAVSAIVLGFLAQSAYKEAAIAKAQAVGAVAAAKVVTPADAVAVLNAEAKP